MFFTLHSLDIFILEFVNLSYHSIFLDNLALCLSYMGVVYFWILVLILLYLLGDKKAKNISKKMFLILIFTFFITQVIKFLVMRPRPYTELSCLVLLATESDYSFPSGHTALSSAMSYLLAKEYNKYYMLIIPIAVALTRLYIGVHYPSDVLGGFILGVGISYFVSKLVNFK